MDLKAIEPHVHMHGAAPGGYLELPEAEADALIDAGFAHEVDKVGDEAADQISDGVAGAEVDKEEAPVKSVGGAPSTPETPPQSPPAPPSPPTAPPAGTSAGPPAGAGPATTGQS